MSAPTHPCGCLGTWTINYRFAGQNYSLQFAGYENDQPYRKFSSYPGCSAYSDIASGCDQRILIEGLTCNASLSNVSFSFVKSDPNCGVIQEYDCINGACLPKTQYNTPGIYASLAECEQACGTGCSGKCISNSDWATIEGLSNQLKQRNCS